MKKSIFIITVLLFSSVLLVACANRGIIAEGTPAGGTTPLATKPVETSAAPRLETPSVGVTESVTTTVGGGSALGMKQPDAGRVSYLLTFDVKDFSGNLIGKVSDLVINLDSGRVQYVIVNVDGKEIAVPPALFNFPPFEAPLGAANAPASGATATPASGAIATPAAGGTSGTPAVTTVGNNYLIFRIDKSAFDNAPRWDATLLPPFGQPANDWDSSLATYWLPYVTPTTIHGVVTYPSPVTGTPAAGATPAAPPTGVTVSGKIHGVVLASKVIGVSIADATGNMIAEIKDIIIDTISWKVLYVIIDYHSTSTSGGFYIPVPPAAFSFNTDGKSFTIVNGDSLLTAAPHFSGSDFPFTGTADWDKDIKAFWDQNIKATPYP